MEVKWVAEKQSLQAPSLYPSSNMSGYRHIHAHRCLSSAYIGAHRPLRGSASECDPTEAKKLRSTPSSELGHVLPGSRTR